MKSSSTTPAAEVTNNDEVVKASSEPAKPAERPWWADKLGKPGETYSDCGGRKLTDIGG
jgi:hypothetical protein